MGREKRAKSLLPSFVLVAGTAVVACEGGSKEWITNPPPPPNYGGFGNEGGTGANPPMVAPCPVPRPVAGSPCLSGLDCYYGTRDRCTSSRAWCVGDVWTISVGAPGCDSSPGAGGDSAGETPIAEGGAGGDSAGAGASGVPIAEGGAGGDSTGAGASGAPIAEGGAAGDGPAPEPVVYCPQALPTLAASCSKPSSVTSFRCDYALSCGTLVAICNGQWQLTFHDSAMNSCLGGAPGN